ncbi:hypothetical protein MAPG_05758 [Magnaporthiopsis poae ATCC 64411]|uniref:Secreted protein n=1 Tax=Magnaporthiopsis poae (strain ATCC 64411 / 73-15) TaxID=644358 RepID=A0A0C4E092_MAGP6|nr:hypothetical protein MAPG_05758 [Magnaporthiopsis poae ATCC 64411]
MRHLGILRTLAACLALNDAAVVLDKRSPADETSRGNSRCELIGRNSHYIFLDSDNGTAPGGAVVCAAGLREQLVARCCKHVNNWECRAAPAAGTGGHAAAAGLHVAFTFGIFCKRPDHCVEDSILAASPADWGEMAIVCE